MFLVLSHQSPDPLYRQVVDQIIDAIARGDLVESQKLPSIRALANDLNTSVITVKRAYFDLENNGLIYSRPGLGSFVASIKPNKLKLEKLAEIKQELLKIIYRSRHFGIEVKELMQLIQEIKEQEHGNDS